MAYEQRDNSGTMFVNDRKEKDTHPDRTGKAMIDGRMYYVSGWIKDGARGKFLSLSFKPVDDIQQDTSRTISQQAPGKIRKPDPISTGRNDDMNDEIPF